MGKNILTKELLLRSVSEWNAARNANPDLKPDLSGVDLRGANLNGANLSGANLIKADLDAASLIDAKLNGTKLRSANFSGANLSKAELSLASCYAANLRGANLSMTILNKTNLSAVNFHGANLSGADFTKADFYEAHFNEVDLRESIFNGARLAYTTFGAVDLSSAIGLETIWHQGPSTIGIDTIYASKGNIPEVFLRGCGVPDSFIEYARSLTVNPIDLYSCFISYSTKDDDFARRIHNDLQGSGVRCWFDEHDIQGGKKVLPQIEEAIRHYDKLLLILSPNSMNSNWVETEILNALQKAQQSQKDVLFPISIVSFDEIKKWKCFDSDSGRDLAREIREYHIPDFSRWGSDQAAYKTAFERLLKDLKQ